MGNLRLFLLMLYFTLPHHFFTLITASKWAVIKPHDLCAIALFFCLRRTIRYDAFTKIFSIIMILYFARAVTSEHILAALLIPFKLFEYLIIFLTLQLLNTKEKKIIILFVYVAVLITFIIYFFGVQIGPNWGGRFFAIYGGPYELSTIFLFILLFNHHRSIFSGTNSPILHLAYIWFSSSKAAIISLIMSRPKLFTGLFVVFVALGISFTEGLTASDNRLVDIIFDASDLMNSSLGDLCFSMQTFENREEYMRLFSERRGYTVGDVSHSSSQRFYTTCIVLSSLDIQYFFLGFGPNFFGVLDNSFLRILTDVGVLGIFLAILLLKQLTKDSNMFAKSAFFIALALSDVFFSGRFLTTLYLLTLIRVDTRYENTNHK